MNGAVSRASESLVIYLIKASKYDEEGYVIRHWRGVLPSNSLACLYGLTEDVRRSGVLGAHLDWNIEVLDEAVHYVDVNKIVRKSTRPGTRTIVCLVGVQTNQFPRASDLALQFRGAGLPVLIGGFHVSGSVSMLGTTPPEIQSLLDAGCTVVLGEVEEHWEQILRDAIDENLAPVYNYLSDLPDLQFKPVPMIHKKYLSKFANPNFGTIDCGRGCPFNCSFCTIINVQGRKMRMRDPEALADVLVQNYRRDGVSYYFFTDDNFARNKNWEKIFDVLIRLRRDQGIKISFMMQVDVLSYRTKDFVSKAKEAGCCQVFIGMESINQKNLEAAGKKQNDAGDFAHLIQAYHDHGISTHVGYIIGFPYDTRESVRDDARRLAEEIQVDQASFFMLTPLPGSRDHLDMVRSGEPMDSDFNNYDSFRATMGHPAMSRQEWEEAYREAWRTFYSFDNMKRILLRTPADRYWDVFKNFLWYKSSVSIEGSHPMITGFFRHRDRLSRRPGFAVDPRFVHAGKRFREIRRYLLACGRLFLEMEELWLQTRKRGEKEQWIIDEIQKVCTDARHWRKLRLQELHDAYARAALKVWERSGNLQTRLKVPSILTLRFMKWNIVPDQISCSRAHLNEYWCRVRQSLRRGRLHRINILKAAANLVCDIKLASQFTLAIFQRTGQDSESGQFGSA